MYKALLHAHSGLRYLVLFLLITLLIRSFNKWKTQQTFDKGDESLSRLNVLVMHLQWMIGLALYFISSKVWFDAATMKNALLRFFTLEHPLMMMVAVVILTIGHVKAKRSDSFLSHKKLFIYNLIGLIIILISIPWPFRELLGAGWF